MTAMDKIKAGEIIVALMEDWAQANPDIIEIRCGRILIRCYEEPFVYARRFISRRPAPYEQLKARVAREIKSAYAECQRELKWRNGPTLPPLVWPNEKGDL